MAAQVEVQTAEVGRTVTGGRHHLSPLSDSSNNSLIDIPSVNEPHRLASEPNKPVPTPKPRLTPKPFSVQKNPTIKPILAPKPHTKPRPESTRLAGYKPELPSNPKLQQSVASSKPRPVSNNLNRPASTSFNSSPKLNTGQTTKPVVQPFKPAPRLDTGDPSRPTPPVPAERQKPSSLASPKNFKNLPAAEWSGTTTKEDERGQNGQGKGVTSLTRAKSMGFLLQAGQEKEAKEKAQPETSVPLRPHPRGTRPRPVSAIFPSSPNKTEAPLPAPRWSGRRPLSADLTAKFESIGLSLHRKVPEATTEEGPQGKALPQKKEEDKTLTSTTPQSTDDVCNPILSDHSNKNKEEMPVKEADEDKHQVSIKSRISLLLDSPSSSGGAAAGQGSDLRSPVQPTPEIEPPVGVKQLIKQLTEDTTPTQSPVLKQAPKPRPLPLDLTKRFSAERSPDPVFLTEAVDRHDINRDPQKRAEESPITPSDQKTFLDLKGSQEQPKKVPSLEGPESGHTFGTISKESGAGNGVQTVRASLFDNIVERHSVLMMDEGSSVNMTKDLLSSPSPFKRAVTENDGTLFMATYSQPLSPSSPLPVLHAFDTVQAVEESRAVSESIPSAHWEDKAMTLRSRRSEGSRPLAEWTGAAEEQPPLAVMPETQPRYLRIGALQKWTIAGLDQDVDMEKGMLKESQREGQVALDKDRERERMAEQEEVAAAPKRLKILQAEEMGKPRATYFALTGQIQEAVSFEGAGTNTGDMNVFFDDSFGRYVLGVPQVKSLPIGGSPSLDDPFGKTVPSQEQEELMMMSHKPPREIRSALDGRSKEEKKEAEKKMEQKKEKARHKTKMKEVENEKQKQLEIEKQAHSEFAQMKAKEMQRDFERQRQKPFEKEKQEFEEKQYAQDRQKQTEFEKVQELEREKQRLEREKQRKLENEKRRELERQRETEREKMKERERQREKEQQKQKEEEQLLELQRQKQKEKEMQQLEKQRLKQKKEKEAEAEKLRQMALDQEMLRIKELEREMENERQKEIEREKQRELETRRQRDLERERQRQQDIERWELENQRLRQQELEKERKKKEDIERFKELERLQFLEFEKQKQAERERQQILELEKRRQLDAERQELENQRLRQQELEKERKRKEDIERLKELERLQLLEYEKQKQAERERQQIVEFEKRRQRENVEREEADRMRVIAKQQEAERQRLKEKQRKEEQERLKLETSPLRPKVLHLDSVLRTDPISKSTSQRSDAATRWKEPYKPGILDIDSFTSQAQPSPNKDLFPLLSVQGLNAEAGGQLQPTPESNVSWKMPPLTSVGISNPVWTTPPQDPWELRSVEMSVDHPKTENRKYANKHIPELLFPSQEERIPTQQRPWSAFLDESLYLTPFPGTEVKSGNSPDGLTSSTRAEQIWLPRELQPQEDRGKAQRRSHGSQLNRLRSRSVSRRSTPAGNAAEGSLSRMRSRSAHREQDRHSWVQQKQSGSGEEEGKDSPVRESDSQYGTWETGLRTDDSLTPVTPSSDSNLSPSPRKPTPAHTPGDRASPFESDTLDGLPQSSSPESQPLSFPDAPTTLLDTSVLRSRAQLGKKRAPRTRPTRAARQSAAQAEAEEGTTEDWLYRDSTETKAESKDDDSDSEEQQKGADAAPAIASQPQRVALFPGMDPSALKVQLKKRGDSDNQIDGPAPSPSQLSRSPKSPFLPRVARVLPPSGGKENGEEDSPQWLKELKSKKRLSQHENES